VQRSTDDDSTAPRYASSRSHSIRSAMRGQRTTPDGLGRTRRQARSSRAPAGRLHRPVDRGLYSKGIRAPAPKDHAPIKPMAMPTSIVSNAASRTDLRIAEAEHPRPFESRSPEFAGSRHNPSRHKSPRSQLLRPRTPKSASRQHVEPPLCYSASSASGSSGAPRPESGLRSRSDGSRRSGKKLDRLDEVPVLGIDRPRHLQPASRDKLREELDAVEDHHTEAVDELDIEGSWRLRSAFCRVPQTVGTGIAQNTSSGCCSSCSPEGNSVRTEIDLVKPAVTAPLFKYLATGEQADESWRP